MAKSKLQFDEIGYWSEMKLEIVRKYADAYSRILTKQPGFTHYYIDGFAGMGAHVSKTTGQRVPGSPLNALNVNPPFSHYFFVDLEGDCVASLRRIVGDRDDVTVQRGDSNQILLESVLPTVRYDQFRRALCLLDPYGLHLNWSVIAKAGAIKTIDLFLNFPVMDMNRNALWRKPELVDLVDVDRMTAMWGDESWREVVYQPHPQADLFGRTKVEKAPNDSVAEAFRERLQKVAGFKFVPTPIPMRNSTNAVLYYLFFASQNPVANKIATDILRHYSQRGVT